MENLSSTKLVPGDKKFGDHCSKAQELLDLASYSAIYSAGKETMCQMDSDSLSLIMTAKASSEDQHGVSSPRPYSHGMTMNHRDNMTDDRSSASLYYGGTVSILYLFGFSNQKLYFKGGSKVEKFLCLTRMREMDERLPPGSPPPAS